MKLLLVATLSLFSNMSFAVEHRVPCNNGETVVILGNPDNLVSQIAHACDQKGGRVKSGLETDTQPNVGKVVRRPIRPVSR